MFPKVGCREPLNHTKFDTIVLSKCIFEPLALGKKRKTSMKVPKQKFGKYCSRMKRSRLYLACYIDLLIWFTFNMANYSDAVLLSINTQRQDLSLLAYVTNVTWQGINHWRVTVSAHMPVSPIRQSYAAAAVSYLIYIE